MRNYPSVSIVIPVYNAQDTFEKCLQSLKNMDYPSHKYEIIIVDNGSADATVKIAHNYTSTVLIEPGLNVGCLRNKGANVANGEIIAFTDSDCIACQNWLKSAVNILTENVSANKAGDNVSVGIVTGRIGIPDDATWVVKTWALNRGKKREDKVVAWASSMNMVIYKDYFFKLKGFSDNLVTYEDVDLSERMINAGYVIMYSENVKITHLGEAKDLVQLYKKEYWRGSGALTLFRMRPQSIRGWRYIFQILLFSISFLGGISCLFLSNKAYFIFFINGHTLLPISRTIMIFLKNGSIKSIGKIFCVWYVYYCARSISFWKHVF